MKKREIVGILLVASISLGAICLVIYTSVTTAQTDTKQTTQTFAAETSFDQYCQNGVYQITKNGKQISCGRAPLCDGKSYDEAAAIPWRENAECWVEDYYDGDYCQAYCAGNIPLCCYKLAETKNAEDCNWPERGYCLPSQCQGVGQRCGFSIGTWCSNKGCTDGANDIPYIPLESRLGGNSQPQPTPTQAPPPTMTPRPSQPINIPTQKPENTPINSTPSVAPQPTQPDTTPTNTSVPTLPIDSQPPDFFPTTMPQPIPTSKLNTSNLPSFSIPAPSFQTPQELARNIINPETISRVDQATTKPLSLPKQGFEYVVSIDRTIEDTASHWWGQLWGLIKKIMGRS